MKIFKHEKSLIETDKIGDGSRIWAFVHILPGAKIGKNANICDHCYIENEVSIGDDVTIKCGVWVWDGVHIADKVFIGPSVVFTNDLFPRSKNTSYEKKETELMEGCSIGANSTILAGIKIGAYSMVGAGSVVTKDVQAYTLVYGNPARERGYICSCGEKMEIKNDKFLCKCGQGYNIVNNKISKKI